MEPQETTQARIVTLFNRGRDTTQIAHVLQIAESEVERLLHAIKDAWFLQQEEEERRA